MKKFTVYPNNYVKSSKIIGASNDQDFEIDENLVTESDILNAIKRLKKEKYGDGKFVVRNGAVRYTSYENDFREYAKLSDLADAINNNEKSPVEALQRDPSICMDYFTDSFGIHHAFETRAYREQTREFDTKYFGITS